MRVDVVIMYQRRGWQTIQVDLGPIDESSVDLLMPEIPGVADLGIPIGDPVPCLVIPAQVAQKIHACTNPRAIEKENRARDIFDIVLLDTLGTIDYRQTREACHIVFRE